MAKSMPILVKLGDRTGTEHYYCMIHDRHTTHYTVHTYKVKVDRKNEY